MYQQMISYVEDFLEKTDINASCLAKRFPFRNRFEHTLRVYEWAKRINEVENGERDIVEIAAIFHDVGKGVAGSRPHGEAGAEICREYLQNINYPENKINAVTEAIRKHSMKDLPAEDLSLEERILIDADLLDEVGALSVLWDALDQGADANPSYYAVYERIHNNFMQLKGRIGALKTKEGHRLYEQRIEFLSSFLNELKYELGI